MSSAWFGQLLERLADLIEKKKVEDRDPFPNDAPEMADDEEG